MESFLHNDHQVLMLVDAHAVIYRAYYAFPNLTKSTGELVNAVFGFSRILLTAIRNLEPDYIAVLFDHKDPTFRHEEYEDYKAHRPSMPDDLRPQIGLVKGVVDALNMPRFELAGYEADDLIGALSTQAAQLDQDRKRGLKTVIVTGDRDLFQLVNNAVHVYLPGRRNRSDQEYDAAQVKKKMGVRPDQIVDMKALMGDSSDNIPGISGIGPKTATTLLTEFETLDGVYAAVEQVVATGEQHPILKGALLEKLQDGKESAYLSQKLAQIDTDAPIKLVLEECKVTGYNKQEAVKLLQDYEFRSLIRLLPNDEFETSIQDSLF